MKNKNKGLKTWNGKPIYTEDLRKTFSVLKTLLKTWGRKSHVVFGDTPPGKEACIEMRHELFDEYADNKYTTAVERKFQLGEHACSCKEKDKYIEKLEEMNEDLFEENVELYIRAGKRYWKEACLWLAAISGWLAFVIALIVG